MHTEYALANGRDSGSALRMFLVPATQHEDGHIRIEIADQKGKTMFDWENALAADLGWHDCAKLLSVFMGCTEETSYDKRNNNRILVKNKLDGTVRLVDLRHELDPDPGYTLAVLDLDANNALRQQSVIRLTPTEGIGIECAIRGGLHTVAFGVPVLTEVR